MSSITPRQAKAGIVDDDAARVREPQLRERRPRAEHAFGRIGLDADALRGDGQPIRFFAGERRKRSAPLGESALPDHDLHLLDRGDAVVPLERNGRRENSQRHNQSYQNRLH
jgi:hypothetical protein